MKTLQIKKLSESAILPTREHKADSGLDIYASEDVIVTTGTQIPTGIAINIPEGYEGTIRPRSGKTSKTKLRVQLGTIDSGYTGEIKVIADCTDSVVIDEMKGRIEKIAYRAEKGEKIAQLVLQRVELPELEVVEQFDTSSERGEKGFGSSDKEVNP